MKLLNYLAPIHAEVEDYVYTPVVDMETNQADEVAFHFDVILGGENTVDVQRLSSVDGVKWETKETVSYSGEGVKQGVLTCSIRGDGRYQKFGFNVCGEPVDTWVSGSTYDIL